nr:uncharacterized protein LOC126541217 [Dermacentor andersoni]
MFGFRANLSTQDVLLQLKEEVPQTMTKDGENVVMALDTKGAFDNVSHAAIMEGLNNTNCGRRIHDYVKDFLTNRAATVGLGELKSDVFSTPSKGTSQGSVISPILFNVAMIGVAERLSRIQGIQHAMYADNITVWVNHGSLGEKQERLQQVPSCIERYVKERGLACSTEMSELLRVGRHPTDAGASVGCLEGQNIPERMIRVLRMWLQASRKCNHTLSLLSKSAEQVGRMITRVSHRRHGMKEDDILKLVRGLIVSRVIYSLPYHPMIKSETEQAETILRKAYKTALHLSRNTPNDKLLQLGISNTFAELAEAQLGAQFHGLRDTATGRALLTRLGRDPRRHLDRSADIPDEIRKTLQVNPIPKKHGSKSPRGQKAGAGRLCGKAFSQTRKHGFHGCYTVSME